MMTRHSLVLWVLLVCVGLGNTGCMYWQMTMRQKRAQRINKASRSVAAKKTAELETCSFVVGGFTGMDKAKSKGKLVVVAVSDDAGRIEIVDFDKVNSRGVFKLYLPDGHFTLHTFLDMNRDGRVSRSEHLANQPIEIDVNKKSSAIGAGTHNLNTIRTDQSPFDINLEVPEMESAAAEGVYTTVEAPEFAFQHAQLGAFHPEAFMKKFNYFIYRPSDHTPNKTPVVFVHGFSGSPKHWKHMIDGLDRTRFSPFLFYYPSGLRLNSLADLLYQTMEMAAKRGHERIVLVAHSMGGLVCRAALKKYAEKRHSDYIPMYISFCTPYGGNGGAQMAVKNAPGIIPCWIDVASDSTFLRELYSPALPKSLQFHLVFGFRDSGIRMGANSDGVISLKSQLDPRAQFSATSRYGFNEDHVSILKSGEVITRFNKILSTLK